MPATLRKSFGFLVASLLLGAVAPDAAVFAGVGGYKKATEGDDVVKDKLYPKKGRVEINGPNVGTILNQSYLDTYFVSAGINDFKDEVWGFSVEGLYAINKDKAERACIENFYNDPDYEVAPECGGSDNLTGRANYGPAYVNIREYNYLLSANAIWNPIYGKQIFFLSAVGYFDIFVTLGGGMAFSTFYPMSTTLSDGRESRPNFPPKDGTTTTASPGGTGPSETDSDGNLMYGTQGRPKPQKQSNFMLQGGLGQKFHFGDKFNLKVELRDHLVLGTPGGFDMFFSLSGGFGLRF